MKDHFYDRSVCDHIMENVCNKRLINGKIEKSLQSKRSLWKYHIMLVVKELCQISSLKKKLFEFFILF